MANNPLDPLQALQAALTVPQNSKEQADLLSSLRESLENHPSPIPVLVDYLLRLVVNAGDSLLKRWILELLQFAICRSTLSQDVRTQMSLKALETLAQLLDDPTPYIVKTSIQTLATVYVLVFRHLCANRSNPTPWDILTTCKARIVEMLWSNTTNAGVKLAAMKFVQRVILLQMRGVSDPRLQNKNDPNISNCPNDHPFIQTAKLEQEGQKLMEALITMLYSSQDVDLLSAMVNSWANLVKLRPHLVPGMINTLKQWTPAALAGQPALGVRSVEKSIRILLVNMSRVPANSQYVPQINETLSYQASRMEKAAIEEKRRRAGLADSRKRPSAPTDQPSDPKRIKLEAEAAPAPSPLAQFDFTSLPAPLITELIVSNLEAFSEADLVALVQAYRQLKGIPTAVPAPAPAPVAAPVIPISATPPTPQKAIPTGPRKAAVEPPTIPSAPRPESPAPAPLTDGKAEPVDPLQMDIDEEEIEFEPEKLNEELGPVQEDQELVVETDMEKISLTLNEFRIPAPPELDENGRTKTLGKALTRIWDGADELKEFAEVIPADSSQAGGNSATELWMLLLVRMITRVAQPPEKNEKDKEGSEVVLTNYYVRQDQLRQTLCDHIMTDFPARVRLATTWMNEEWYNDRIRLAKDSNWRPNYDAWLNQVVAGYQTILDGKDRTFARFLLDLPAVPSEVLDLLRDLCVDSTSPDRLSVGYATLRGLVIQRPSMRDASLNILLELTTHPERRTRAAAINTVKTWANTPPLDETIQNFALEMLRKLEKAPSLAKTAPTKVSLGEDHEMANGEEGSPQQNGEVKEDQSADEAPEASNEPSKPETTNGDAVEHRIELPAEKSQVLQHLELLFALSVKVPGFLEEIFKAYGKMDISVQEAFQTLITPLIRSLGSSHRQLLAILKTCPTGAESLALRVLTIFTEHGRPSAQLVGLVKALIVERDLDARFLIPIIAEMDKSDIMRYLPRIVSILNGQPEPKSLVRQVFGSVVTTPPQTFGSVTSNMPRVRQSELLTPAELMVLLHHSEKEIGLKSAIEAIGICFSMTDVFRSEILAVVMQQIMDEPVLPVLFLRTVIQAVTTYKSLVGFVSTTLLSRLITKKIWTNPPLWEGFIRCAKVIAPASFGALLQLPKDQLRELVDKQPSLKAGLRDHVMKKAPNKARVAGFLDIFGEANPDSSVTLPPPTAQEAPES
ncbi:Symplekin tight junction protein C terminal-domain-containing protein [Ephemerocybe angulata]|uniref:Symplekin tight junction protein C terminal-domain-containing protein n=1 Tax=Ephemerocybe angulata TaxID=980116 RepID=A0A8H6HTL6_9AGAR|nr:Symplekin tight junction protein C terminal-domain-containing protein [Tulosesus angulatus]